MFSSSIVSSARRTLRDDFPATEAHKDTDFIDYVNRAAKVVVNTDASASVITTTIPLVEGNIQSIPADGARILNLLHNDLEDSDAVRIKGRRYKGKHAIKNMELATLQAQIPDWAGGTQYATAIYSSFSDDDPTSFIVYPANNGNGLLKAVYAVTPPDVTEISSDPAGTINIPERYLNIMINATISFALARDSENRELMARSQAFMQSALGELGFKATKDVEETPENTLRT